MRTGSCPTRSTDCCPSVPLRSQSFQPSWTHVLLVASRLRIARTRLKICRITGQAQFMLVSSAADLRRDSPARFRSGRHADRVCQVEPLYVAGGGGPSRAGLGGWLAADQHDGFLDKSKVEFIATSVGDRVGAVVERHLFAVLLRRWALGCLRRATGGPSVSDRCRTHGHHRSKPRRGRCGSAVRHPQAGLTLRPRCRRPALPSGPTMRRRSRPWATPVRNLVRHPKRPCQGNPPAQRWTVPPRPQVRRGV